jgi:hypothetical protein
MKTPKAPKFQNLPTLQGLAERRGQTISSLLKEWDIKDAASLTDRLKREGLAPIDDVSTLFPQPKIKSALVELTKEKIETQKISESESKKTSKAKLSLDVSITTTEDRNSDKSVTLDSTKTGKSKGET